MHDNDKSIKRERMREMRKLQQSGMRMRNPASQSKCERNSTKNKKTTTKEN